MPPCNHAQFRKGMVEVSSGVDAERSAACFASAVSNEVFMKGDPSTDSVRRHMERVLNDPRSRTLGKAAVAGATAWGVWRLLRAIKPSMRRAASTESRQH